MRARLFLCLFVAALPGAASAQTKGTEPAKPAEPAKKPAEKPATKAKVAALTGGYAPPGYASMVKKWHEPAKLSSLDPSGRPRLVLVSINRGERVELDAKSEQGGFSPLDVDRASHLLRSADGQEHPPDPRLLDVAYALQRRFAASEVRFLSGYRTPKRPGSNHGLGRALDLIVPGATDEEVATFARTSGFVGVGIYPTSGFVHLDVRDRSFYWVDKSGPGKPNKTVGILAGEAAKSDAEAKKAGKLGTEPARIGRDVDAALAARAKAFGSGAAQPASDEDPYDDDH